MLLVSAITICLGVTYMNSARLVHEFERTVESKDFEPEAESLELAEIDRNSHRGWKITAARSSGDSKLEVVDAEEVEAQIFDDENKVKMVVKASKAKVNRASGITYLEGRPEALLIERNTKLIADQFVIKSGQPIDAVGNVKILLKPDGSNYINAEKAVITQALDDITLYSVSQSPVANNLLLSGGVLRIEHSSKGAGAKPQRIIVSNGAWVKNGSTTCRSARLDVLLDSNGNPSLATFTGSPVANQSGKEIRASKIEYSLPSGKVKASGQVQSNFI